MRTVNWRGSDGSVEWNARGSVRAHPARQADGLLAFGEQRTSGYEVTWQLSIATGTPAWAADRLDVRVVGSAGHGSDRKLNRTLLLERSTAGWRSLAWSTDDAALPDPGLAGDAATGGALDVVLDSCPLSHLAPTRRIGLASRAGDRRRGVRQLAGTFPVLRVRLPSLAVTVTRQRYSWVEDAAGERTLLHSFAGEPPVRLMLDQSGLPMRFGELSAVPDSARVA